MNWDNISKLKCDLQAAEGGASPAAADTIPVHWVLATLLDLFREYPNGVTEAVARTELLVRWKLHRHRSRELKKIAGWACDGNDVVCAQIIEYIAAQQILVLHEAPAINADTFEKDAVNNAPSKPQNMHLFVHQRFHRYLPPSTTAAMHPFIPMRRLLLTTLQPLERRQPRGFVQCLPTENMIIVLDPSHDTWDRSLVDGATCISTLSALHRIPTDQLHVQLLCAKVVSVECTRTCVSSVNASRRLSIVVASSDASHTFLFVLWDTQTHLGSTLHPGDTLILDCPYLNIRDSANKEHQAIFDESPGHAAHLFLEYGSSTILFVVPAQSIHTDVVTQPNKVAFAAPVDQITKFSNLAEYPLALDEWTDLPDNCYNTAFLGQVADLHVGHASPLRQQFAATYFGAKGMASSMDKSPTVVLTLRSLQPPFPLLSIEVTGPDQVASALATCDLGHLVFVQGVVLVKSGHTTMGLCANWSTLHPAFSNGKVESWNHLVGYLHSPDFYSVRLLSQLGRRTTPSNGWPQLAVVRVSFASSWWLDPSPTTVVHRACRRPVRPKRHEDSHWSCEFCKLNWNDARHNVEIGFTRLAIQIEDGSASINAVMGSTWVEQLLGCTAMAFDQLPLKDQTDVVNLKCSTGQVYVAVVSSCPSVQNIVWRIDQAIALSGQVTNQILQFNKV